MHTVAMSLRHLFARFDTALLRPPAWPAAHAARPAARPAPADDSHTAALLAWCLDGAGPGGALRGSPDAPAQPATAAAWRAVTRFAWRLADQAEMAAAPSAALHLDGSHLLDACTGGLARLRLRAAVKWRDASAWRDASGWRPLQAGDIWDAGHLIDGPDLAERAGRFTPRRACLMLADAIPAARRPGLIQALQQRSPAFDHPVRLLLPAA